MSAKVEQADAKQAEEIMRFALFREVPKRQRRKKRKLNNGDAVRKGSDASDDEDSDESDDEEPASAERMATPAKPKSRSAAPPAAQPPRDPIWGDESQDVSMAVDEHMSSAPSTAPTADGQIRPDR